MKAMRKFVKIKISDEDGKVLMHHYLRAGKYDLPAGKIEENELPAKAAARELLERTGFHADERNLEKLGEEGEFLLFGGKKKDLTQVAKPGEKGGYATDVRWVKEEMTPIDIFKELEKLNFPIGEYVVAGSGIMSAKGIRPAYDLDIVVTQELFDECLENGWELRPWTRTGKVGKSWLKKEGVELLLELGFEDEAMTAKDLMKEGEIVNGVPFLSLHQLIKFKKDYGRPKDFEDIALMEEYLRRGVGLRSGH